MSDRNPTLARLRPHLVALALTLLMLFLAIFVGNDMAWVKTGHIVSVISWFAGVFYLPRLYVYHADVEDDEARAHARFVTMERKLFRFASVFMWLTVAFGTWMAVLYGWTYFKHAHWLHLKLVLVTIVVLYYFWLGHLGQELAQNRPRSHRFYRVINEVPVLVLLAIVILVVVKPF